VHACQQFDARVDQPVDFASVDVAVRDPVRPSVAILIEDLTERDIVDEVEIVARREVAQVVVRVRGRNRRAEGAAVLDPGARLVEELERVRGDRRVPDRDRQIGRASCRERV